MNTNPPCSSPVDQAPVPPGRQCPETAPIDRAVLLEQCMGEARLAAMVLERFESQLRSDFSQITEAIKARDLACLPRVLHALKGTAGAVGARRLYQLAAAMEAHARAGELEPVLGEGPEVCREVQSCLTCAVNLRAGLC